MSLLTKRDELVALARALGGLPVYGCLPGSPADRAGIQYGDVLMSVDGLATPSWDAYLAARAQSGPSIAVKIFRDGADLDIKLVLRRGAEATFESVTAALGLTIVEDPPGDKQ
jgi:S1-C subfamily serine protease